jgi:hypothetical protein
MNHPQYSDRNYNATIQHLSAFFTNSEKESRNKKEFIQKHQSNPEFNSKVDCIGWK